MATTITKAEGVALYEALGVNTAAKWPATRMAAKLAKVQDLVDEDTDIADDEVQATLDKVLKAIEDGDEIKVLTDAQAKKAAAGAKTKTKTKPEKGTEDAEDAEEPKPAKGSKTKAAKKPKEPKEPKGPTKSRSYYCGVVLKKHKATEYDKELAEEADKLYEAETGRSNIRETVYAMRWAVQAVQGYIAK